MSSSSKMKFCHYKGKIKKEKGLTLKLQETFLFLELLYCDSLMDSTLWKMFPDPRENKTLWTVS